jgi:hypothetical protein
MKQLSLGQIIFGLVLISLITCGFTKLTHHKIPDPDHKYSLSLTKTEWNSIFQILNNSKEIMRKSSYPGNVIAELTDSLTSIQNKIQLQGGPQISADTVAKSKK